MDALELIENYNKAHAGKSALLDIAMGQTKRALQDACRLAEKSDYDFARANLFLARNTIVKMLEAIPSPETIRTILTEIYNKIEDEI